jgi:hypothetical protein
VPCRHPDRGIDMLVGLGERSAAPGTSGTSGTSGQDDLIA